MKKIKILGFGSVVKAFLKNINNDFPGIIFEIYHRSSVAESVSKNIIFRDIKNYRSDENPTFYCCSINEEEFLRNSKYTLSRLDVAKPNLKLIRSFIQTEYFNSGSHFILTNPSDLIAEFIIRQTNNKNVYALGLNIDSIRYKEIFPKFNIDPTYFKFNLIGNHWDFPLINFDDDFPDHKISLLANLMAALKKKVKSEFQGFKPPVISGATALHDAISSLCYQKDLLVSGFIDRHDAVGGGILNTITYEFNQPNVNKIANNLLSEAINFHKATYHNLMSEIS